MSKFQIMQSLHACTVTERQGRAQRKSEKLFIFPSPSIVGLNCCVVSWLCSPKYLFLIQYTVIDILEEFAYLYRDENIQIELLRKSSSNSR